MLEFELTKSEMFAVEATKLDAFPINIHNVRRAVSEVLMEFGRHNFFDEYTVHNYSHVHDMLKMLDWIIPEETAKLMTPAEWLMLVLAIYFHDLGLIVTREEFENRNKSIFDRFCAEKLFVGADGGDYKQKLDNLDREVREKFLYQEFVRENHGLRIRQWIEGKASHELGFAKAAVEELNGLVGQLGSTVKKDLGILCESHNLDDIDDFRKYRISQPYGNSDEETANIHYCAIILRTVDLLQITKQRAPSRLYRLISPTDPVSQIEWAKQNAVTRVRSKMGIDREGNQNANAPRDTIELYAHFTNADGFFGLNAYVTYARQQIKRSFDAIDYAKRKHSAHHDFPWRDIDDDNVEVDGFLKEPFGFTLDQGKILDLLTGHTLYNDSSIVLRELIQNAIDAVRLQAILEGKAETNSGKIDVVWNSRDAALYVIDNGTGMSQEVIRRHLLKVGSSRYQDPQFKEKHPEFSPISRFGIGVLSAFMIADTVEITTSSPEDIEARKISLRSVHGKYLIRLLDKNSAPEVQSIKEHGTIFKLTLRKASQGIDVLSIVRRWIVLPRCRVTVTVDDLPSVEIGFNSTKSAVESLLEEYKTMSPYRKEKFQVVEKQIEGVSVAYALKWDHYYKDWSFVTMGDRGRPPSEFESSGVCTCVEGISVEFASPGFRQPSILAVCNATGKGSPKTNVARSSLEDTPESNSLVQKVYQIYTDHVRSEVKRLHEQEKYSLTWAVSEIAPLCQPLTEESRLRVLRPKLLKESINTLPMYLVENDRGRLSYSLSDLEAEERFWTVDSEVMRSSERLVREVHGKLTVQTILEEIRDQKEYLPKGNIVCNSSSSKLQADTLRSKFEVDKLIIHEDSRRLDLSWGLIKDKPKWFLLNEARDALVARGARYASIVAAIATENRQFTGLNVDLYIPVAGVECDAAPGYVAAKSMNSLYVIPDTPISSFFSELTEGDDLDIASLIVFATVFQSLTMRYNDSSEKTIERLIRRLDISMASELLRRENEFIAAMVDTDTRVFDSSAWSQRAVWGIEHIYY